MRPFCTLPGKPTAMASWWRRGGILASLGLLVACGIDSRSAVPMGSGSPGGASGASGGSGDAGTPGSGGGEGTAGEGSGGWSAGSGSAASGHAGKGGGGLGGSAGAGGTSAGGKAGAGGAQAGGAGTAGGGGVSTGAGAGGDAGGSSGGAGAAGAAGGDAAGAAGAAGEGGSAGGTAGQGGAGSCENGLLDGDETAVDCGGSCAACPPPSCKKDMDCSDGRLCALGMCLPTGRSCLEIHKRDATAADGAYVLDPDGAGPVEPFVALCDMQSDGGGWTQILRADAPYKPTVGAVGDIGVEGTDFAKLSDAAINALAPGSRTFRLRANDDATAMSLYFLTGARFVDTLPSWGVTADAMGLVAFGPSFADASFRQVSWLSLGTAKGYLDTIRFKLTGNNCSRLFSDYQSNIACFGANKPGYRCVSLDEKICPSKPGVRPFRLWLREWTPNEGLLFAHSFDEGSGDAAGDSSGNKLVGKLTGDADSAPIWTPDGHHGAALSFDGTNRRHVLTQLPDSQTSAAPPSDALYLPTGHTSYSVWYRPAGALSTKMALQAITHAPGGLDRWLIFAPGPTDSSGSVFGYLWNGGTAELAPLPAPAGWHHLVWTLQKGVGTSFYVDGQLAPGAPADAKCGVGCSDFVSATQHALGAVPLAADKESVPFFDGTLDESFVYRMPLLPEDVKLLYESQK